jgi:translocation and assembly module TamA
MQHTLIVLMILFFINYVHAEDVELPTHLIEIRGNKHFSTPTLQEVMSVDTKSFFAFWKEDVPRIKDKLLPTLQATLESFYDSEGFYDAKFTIEETNTTVTVSIKENQPVAVKSIEIKSDYTIDSLILPKKGYVFRAKDFIATKSSIIEALLNEGYCSYQLDTKAYVDLDKHEVELKYDLKKGEVCTFGKPNIKGLKSIDEEVILSRVRAKEGERFDPKKVKETYSSIYSLNSFDAVQVNVDRKIYNVVPIDITLSEVEAAYHFEGGIGYDTYIGARVHASIIKKNFFGNAQQTGLKLSWSQREQLAVGKYYKPALFSLFGYGIDFGTQFGYSNLEFKGFQEEKVFAKVYLEHNEGRLKLRGGLGVENIDISLIDNLKKNEVLTQAIIEGNFLLFYPYVDVVYDARDDKLNPKYGYYLAASLEYGIPYKPDATSYTKTFVEGRYIHTFDKLTLATVAKVGVVDKSSKELPESKLFFAGGSFSNRAYGFNTIGVIESPTSDSIAGASSMLNLSLEADYPIWGNLSGAVFTDNTMLNEDSYDFTGDIITSAGVGVRYLTPIGPFKLDVGFNVNEPSQYGISFQIGQSF